MLFGRVLDGEGGGRAIGWEEARAGSRRHRAKCCGCISAATGPACRNGWRELGIPEPTAELLVSDETRPRAFREGEALVRTLRGINFNPGAEPEDMVSMQVWSDGKRAVHPAPPPLQRRATSCAEIDAGRGPARCRRA